jgi:hypothetical protein
LLEDERPEVWDLLDVFGALFVEWSMESVGFADCIVLVVRLVK